ncbi:MAG: CcdB family protein [Rhodocyclaceae bacterium]|nr:CcdB family protein [Rhodocyclaceae bacterium]
MGQFSIHRNCNKASAARYPFLLDVQAPLLDRLDTRLVIPLTPLESFDGKAMSVLSPVFDIDGCAYVLLTPQMAGIARKELGAAIADLSDRRDLIIAAIDLLVTGC